MNYYVFQIKTALKDFERSKVRTFLTSLGIMIGVFSVVILIAIGIGLRNYIEGQFESLGSNLLFVVPGNVLGEDGSFEGFSPDAFMGSFDDRDVSSLERGLEGVEYIIPLYSNSVTVEQGAESESATIFAGSADVFAALSLEAEIGDVFSDSDVGKKSKVVVLGNKLATNLFSDINSAVGQNVRFSNQRYRVIGVLEEKGGGGFGGPSFDEGVYMPYTTTYSNLNPDREFQELYIGVTNEEDVDRVKEDAEEVLQRRYEDDEFSVVKQTELVNAINQIFGVINIVLVAIGSISLVVGGIGIMNIMYANVTERTKEIGIRRAIGATEKDILFQFLAESIMLSLLGGISGLLLAALVVVIVKPYFPVGLDMAAVLIAIGISSAIGIFFGVFPARRAASLTPIEAIRYE